MDGNVVFITSARVDEVGQQILQSNFLQNQNSKTSGQDVISQAMCIPNTLPSPVFLPPFPVCAKMVVAGSSTHICLMSSGMPWWPVSG